MIAIFGQLSCRKTVTATSKESLTQNNQGSIKKSGDILRMKKQYDLFWPKQIIMLHQSTQKEYERGDRKGIHCSSGNAIIIRGNENRFTGSSNKCSPYKVVWMHQSMSQYKYAVSELIFSLHCHIYHFNKNIMYIVHMYIFNRFTVLFIYNSFLFGSYDMLSQNFYSLYRKSISDSSGQKHFVSLFCSQVWRSATPWFMSRISRSGGHSSEMVIHIPTLPRAIVWSFTALSFQTSKEVP